MTHVEFAEVVAGLSSGDFTKGGIPKIGPLNHALTAAGFAPMSAGARDEMMDAWWAATEAGDLPVADEPEMEAQDALETVEVTIHEAGASKVSLHIIGVGQFDMRIGEPCTLPVAALDALNNAAGITYSLTPTTGK